MRVDQPIQPLEASVHLSSASLLWSVADNTQVETSQAAEAIVLSSSTPAANAP